MNVYQLTYFSAATRPVTDAMLLDILSTARTNNARAGITGLLIHSDGWFLQTLEGEREAVQRCYGRITADPRHRDCTIISDGDVDRAEFDGWELAFYTPRGREDRLLSAHGVHMIDHHFLQSLLFDRCQARSLMASALLEAERQAA